MFLSIYVCAGFPSADLAQRSQHVSARCCEVSFAQAVEKQTVERTSEEAVLENELDNVFAGLSGSLFGTLPEARGVSLESLIGNNLAPPGSAPAPSSGTEEKGDDDDEDALIEKQRRGLGGFRSSTAAVASRAGMIVNDQTDSKAKAKAKSKAKAKPNPAAAGSINNSGIDKNKGGRPYVSRKTLALQLLDEYMECGEGEKFFGDVVKYRRNMDSVLKNYVACIDTVEKPLPADVREKLPDDAEHQRIRKRLAMALDVARQWASSKKTYDQTFHEVYCSSLQFLKAEPRCEPPFPNWLKQRFITRQVESSSPTTFFQYLTDDCLKDAGYTSEGRRSILIRELVQMKAMTVTKGLPENTDPLERVLAFVGAFPSHLEADMLNEAALCTTALKVLSDPSSATPTMLEETEVCSGVKNRRYQKLARTVLVTDRAL